MFLHASICQMDDWNFDDRRASAETLLNELRDMLPKHIVARDVSPRSKLPFKALMLCGALVWRIEELGRSALRAYDDQMHVSGILLARAVVETTAVLYVLHRVVSDYAGGEADSLDERLMRGIFGSRNRDDRPDARSILSDIDRVAKTLPDFRAMYDELSEYAHPNDSGTASAFAQLHRSGQAAMFTPLGENARRRAWTLIESLTASLLLAAPIYSDFRSQIPGFSRKCEDDLQNT